MSKDIERDWITGAGLRARRVRISRSRPLHRYAQESWVNGYVGVPKVHPLHGVYCSDPIPLAARQTAGGDARLQRPLDQVIDCHGGLTFSDTFDDDPEGLWWFGFSTLEDEDVYSPRNDAPVDAQCESIARQIVNLLRSTPSPTQKGDA